MQTAFSRRLTFQLLTLLVLTTSLTGCTREWWTRGQPPAISEIVSRAETRLNEAIATNATKRQDFVPLAKDLHQALLGGMGTVREGLPAAQVMTSLVDCRNSFIKLEHNLSPGSRAAYGELSGQMREFERIAREGQALSSHSFELFSARTMFFLASELSVPAPVAS